MDNDSEFWHEKLDVYRHSLSFYGRIQTSIIENAPRISAVDHLDRASESILCNIVAGNSAWSIDARIQQFSVACGSALECAACLDVLCVKDAIDKGLCENEKIHLARIVQMLLGLCRSQSLELKETGDEWESNENVEQEKLFRHERLDVYQVALCFIRWTRLLKVAGKANHHIGKLDSLSTSIALNIAEGNGRLKGMDHLKFIDIAHRSTLKTVVLIDVLKVKTMISVSEEKTAKGMLRRIDKMLLAMRGYFHQPR